jgi:hypothetical protein
VYERLFLKVICTVNGQRVAHCPVHVSYKYLRNLPNEKKAKEAPWWLAIYYVLKYRRFFYSKTLD